MTMHHRFRRGAALLLVLSLGGLAACGDNPVGDDHEEHPEGLALLNAQGQAVVTIAEGPTVTGQIAVAVSGTQTYTVVAISEDGDRLALDGDELDFQVSEIPQLVTAVRQGVDRLVVTGGAAAGAGTLRLELVHEGHAELGGFVPVVVQ